MIEAVLPRRTKFSRKTARRAAEEQVLAANVDVVFLVTLPQRRPQPAPARALLTLARASGAQPVVLLTKSRPSGDDRAALVAEVGRSPWACRSTRSRA